MKVLYILSNIFSKLARRQPGTPRTKFWGAFTKGTQQTDKLEMGKEPRNWHRRRPRDWWKLHKQKYWSLPNKACTNIWSTFGFPALRKKNVITRKLETDENKWIWAHEYIKCLNMCLILLLFGLIKISEKKTIESA
jgi:hypothetical protein